MNILFIIMNDTECLEFYNNNLKGKRYPLKYVNRMFPNFISYIRNRFNDSIGNESIKELIYRIEHKLEEIPKCIICGKNLKFFNNKNNYQRMFCSKECEHSSKGQKIIKEKCYETKLKRYGTGYYNNRDKYKQTNLERFGYENPNQNKEIKEKAKVTRKNTMLEKYGVENSMYLDSTKEKYKQTCLKRYGVEHPYQNEEIQEKMWPLPVGNLFMVGSRTRTKLNSRGIYTIGDLASQDVDYLHSWLKSHGLLIWNYAHGIEDSPVRVQSVPVKSVGNSTTTSFDVDTKKEACMILLSLSEMVSMRLRELDKCANVISISLKSDDFFSYSHQRKLEIPTDITNSIYETAVELFEEMWGGQPIRRFSIELSELCSNEFFQLSLFERDRKKERNLDNTIDKIRCKYGYNSVFRSCFLYSGIKPITGGVVMEEEYPMMSSLL